MKRWLWILLGWAATFIGASYAIKNEIAPAGAASWTIAAVPAVMGLWVVLGYARYLRDADELQRLIHYRAMAVGFGATWLALSAYPLFERLGAPAMDAGNYILVAAIAYSAAILQGARRYW